jgi:hypothetical protein
MGEIAKLDKILEKQAEIVERMACVEASANVLVRDVQEMRHDLKKHDERIAELESQRSFFTGGVGFAAWVATIGVAIAGVLK